MISGRVGVLGSAGVAVFVIIVIILLRLIPVPRKDTDYLVIGTLATFGTLAMLFAVVYFTDRRRIGSKDGDSGRGQGAKIV